MRRPRYGASASGLQHAFDEVRFGAERTLNLRESLPAAQEAVVRAESWLRQQQVQNAGEVLVITGRGNQSPDGVSVVREAVLHLLYSLRRRGVVSGHQEHTPGSFVVTLAPVRALWEAPKRRRERAPRLPAPPSLDALDAETRNLLRDLAEHSLDLLGARDRDHYIESEMLRQFASVAASVGEGPDREARLKAALRVALEQYD